MIKMILGGANGKMGKVVASIVEADPNCEIAAGLDINTAAYGNFPIYAVPEDIQETADVIIDFSHPSLFEPLLQYAYHQRIPTVICTTGLTDEQNRRLKLSGERIPVFQSANMSVGVNLLIDLVQKAVKVLEENFDIEIVEKHHNQKIDAPSGTALAIADAIVDASAQPKEYVYDRHSVRKKRAKEEIGLHAVRGGTIVGEHDVIFAGQDEILEIRHSAASKEIFAVGAVKAAKFLIGKNPGVYSMRDLVGEL